MNQRITEAMAESHFVVSVSCLPLLEIPFSSPHLSALSGSGHHPHFFSFFFPLSTSDAFLSPSECISKGIIRIFFKQPRNG